MRKVDIRVEKWPLHEPFVISRMAPQLNGEVIVVEVEEEGQIGRGECERMDVFEEDYPDVLAMVESVKGAVENGLSREELQALLPSGAARNAVDCALFELESKLKGVTSWQLAKLSNPPKEVTTVYTLSLGSPEAMSKVASKNQHLPILKLKLGSEGDLERVKAVRRSAPNTRLVIDANTRWTFSQLKQYLPELKALGVEMIEQPLSPNEEHLLEGFDSSIPIVADESCIDRSSLAVLKQRYQGVNIKLDKTGGITEALALLKDAKEAGFYVMVGCMLGTSLAMAPALLLAQEARWVDLDGPLLLSKDRSPSLVYRHGIVGPTMGVWG